MEINLKNDVSTKKKKSSSNLQYCDRIQSMMMSYKETDEDKSENLRRIIQKMTISNGDLGQIETGQICSLFEELSLEERKESPKVINTERKLDMTALLRTEQIEEVFNSKSSSSA
jgi:hypothetical protein